MGILAVINLGVDVLIQMILPFPYGLGLAVLFGILIPIYSIVKWSREWNTQISRGKEEDKTTYSKSPMMLLQERYAKDEITKEEFDKIKEDLKD